MKTILKDRVLWFDGDVTLTAEELKKHILCLGNLDGVYIDNEADEDVVLYNKLSAQQFIKKIKLNKIYNNWNIKSSINNEKLYNYIIEKFTNKIVNENFSKNDIINRLKRIKKEYSLYEKLELLELLQCAIYIVDVFEKKNIKWGTGRGSSCASYILYVIGLHEIDGVLYDIDYKEFFKIDG